MPAQGDDYPAFSRDESPSVSLDKPAAQAYDYVAKCVNAAVEQSYSVLIPQL